MGEPGGGVGIFRKSGTFCLVGPGGADPEAAKDSRFSGEGGRSLWSGWAFAGSDAVEGQSTGVAPVAGALGELVESQGGLSALYSSCRYLAFGEYPTQ